MGWGDEIMATAQARALRAADPKHRRVHVLDRNGQPRWHAMFEGNPNLAEPQEQGDFLQTVNGPGLRPYIAEKTTMRWVWRTQRCQPGEIYFRREEKEFAARLHLPVVVEPMLKNKASPNKNWGWERWRAFAHQAAERGIELVQLGTHGSALLPGAKFVYTPDFRHACAALSRARAYVGHEGGLHHAAAAVGVPAVVIFGGFISPAQTGYEAHRNLFTGGKPCGMRQPCQHCEKAMQAIHPEQVIQELEAVLVPAPRHLAA